MGRAIRKARDPCWYLEIPASVMCLWDEHLSDAESLVCQAGAAGKEQSCGTGQEAEVHAGVLGGQRGHTSAQRIHEYAHPCEP